ncbi:MAG TPA: ABC transporter permease [Spirochaetia bacterium]|nr:MAG: hypothetical protein A2Y41_02800 [Spirochaetes bacterium GWB1_36_13]HCL57782.1 ABC transporter permease [Spirochaetia bacterium]
MKGITDISLFGFLSGYILAALILWIHWIGKTGLIKQYLIALLRMSVQLIGIGYLLNWIFHFDSFLVISGLILIMIFASVQIILSNTGASFKTFFIPVFLISFFVNTLITAFFIFIIVRPEKWSDGQYLIPAVGMLLGNSMNGGVIALKRILKIYQEKKSEIEEKLSFGASPKEAFASYFQESLKLSLLPHISSMAGMGLVSLPGMMTGQILSGASPIIAVKYQIAIMIAILSVTTAGNYFMLTVCSKKFFTKDWRVKEKV